VITAPALGGRKKNVIVKVVPRPLSQTTTDHTSIKSIKTPSQTSCIPVKPEHCPRVIRTSRTIADVQLHLQAEHVTHKLSRGAALGRRYSPIVYRNGAGELSVCVWCKIGGCAHVLRTRGTHAHSFCFEIEKPQLKPHASVRDAHLSGLLQRRLTFAIKGVACVRTLTISTAHLASSKLLIVAAAVSL
jgi:hypothetical protein